MGEGGQGLKRIFDIMFSSLLIVLLIPVFLVLSILVKVTSRGPVLFKQRRIGKEKTEFYIYKFRTMYLETPKNMPTHLLKNPDKYITPVGKLLRKTSLDELPQLINIIKGEMSFVGPRPALFNQYDLISLRDEQGVNYFRPGVTGWAQINGRDELEIPEKVKFDSYYIKNQSLWFDIKIIFITFYKALFGYGVVEGKRTLEKV
ncbi:MAG: gumD [Clostridiaceae bacterium]|jgi:O-antigen biosynthesis protein WbqP|nr:gumD [Clostridiaceae bacterium]